MGKTVSKPIQVALDCFLWRYKNFDITNFEQVYRKLFWSNNKCKKVNKFIKTCKKTALSNTGCKILQTTGQVLNVTDTFSKLYMQYLYLKTKALQKRPLLMKFKILLPPITRFPNKQPLKIPKSIFVALHH